MKQADITVAGCGLVGSLLALHLARRGFEVQAFERRSDLRRARISAGRSINLALSVRGLHALAGASLAEKALEQAIPMEGRTMHDRSGTLTFQPYGVVGSQRIHSISRAGLNALLMDAAEATERVQLHFEAPIEADGKGLRVAGTRPQRIDGPVVGTDGAASAVREVILAHTQGSCRQDMLSHGYKELTMPPAADGDFRLRRDTLHIWPRAAFMLIALPNIDGSFTCTLFLPHEGDVSFEALQTPDDVRTFFAEEFADALPHLPELEREFFENPTGHLGTIYLSTWHHQDRLVLGDAAHAIVPFFGQGMNAGFEDVSLLCDQLDGRLSEKQAAAWTSADWQALFGDFAPARKPDADAIAAMALDNFVEMRDRVADPDFLLRKDVEQRLHASMGSGYRSRYSLVSFSRVPYGLAQRVGDAEDVVLDRLCTGLHSSSELDLAIAVPEVEQALGALMQEVSRFEARSATS